jgi:hypothetical protein
MPFNTLTVHRPSGRAYHEQNRIRGSRWHRRSDVLPKDVRFHPWTLGFRQFSFSPIAQALQSHSAHVFGCPLLYQHAVVPSPFRVQVSRSPRSHCPELRPPLVAIRSARDTAHTFALIRLLATRAFCHTGALVGDYSPTELDTRALGVGQCPVFSTLTRPP